jgi:hypothetical protein
MRLFATRSKSMKSQNLNSVMQAAHSVSSWVKLTMPHEVCQKSGRAEPGDILQSFNHRLNYATVNYSPTRLPGAIQRALEKGPSQNSTGPAVQFLSGEFLTWNKKPNQVGRVFCIVRVLTIHNVEGEESSRSARASSRSAVSNPSVNQSNTSLKSCRYRQIKVESSSRCCPCQKLHSRCNH